MFNEQETAFVPEPVFCFTGSGSLAIACAYRSAGARFVAIADPVKRTVEWLALTDGRYEAVAHSRLIDLSVADLVREIEWP